MGAPAAVPWTAAPGHLRLRVRLTPRAGMDRIDGVAALSDGSAVLQARVRAVPESGAANDALIRLLARALDLPRSRLRVAGGQTSRIKEITIEGEPAAVAAALAELAGRSD